MWCKGGTLGVAGIITEIMSRCSRERGTLELNELWFSNRLFEVKPEWGKKNLWELFFFKQLFVQKRMRAHRTLTVDPVTKNGRNSITTCADTMLSLFLTPTSTQASHQTLSDTFNTTNTHLLSSRGCPLS